MSISDKTFDQIFEQKRLGVCDMADGTCSGSCQVDHLHLPPYLVRGVLCAHHNASLGMLESGRRLHSPARPEELTYLSRGTTKLVYSYTFGSACSKAYLKIYLPNYMKTYPKAKRLASLQKSNSRRYGTEEHRAYMREYLKQYRAGKRGKGIKVELPTVKEN